MTFNIFSNLVSSRLSGSDSMRVIANFLGTTEELAIKFFISSVFSSFGMVSSSIIAVLATILMKTCPFVSVLVAGISIFFFYESRHAQMEMEKGKNYILILNYLFNRLSNVEQCMDKNVLVIAIDEYKSFFSFFRANSGVWCDVMYINNLPSAPLARDIPVSRRIIQDLANIRNEISLNGNINVDSMKRRIARYRSFNGIGRNLINNINQ